MLSGTPNRSVVPKAVWSTIWKLKFPVKIITFIWKLLHNSLQVKSILNNRGIASEPTCPLCNEDEETISHLFLFCQFSKAVWHGSNLSIHTSALNQTNAIQWLSACMLRNDLGPHEKDSYLQTLCTTLWSLWNHRNKVFHEGINPNPMMVILTFQSLVCRFQEAFRTDDYHSQEHDRPALTSATTRNWQLIVKLVGCTRRKCNRSGYDYEANDLKGDQIFSGGASSLSPSFPAAVQNAIVEAAIKARDLGFRQVLFLTDCKRITQVCNGVSQSRWQETSMMTDLHYLT